MPLAALAGRFGRRGLDAPFDVADGGEVFIHAAAVGSADGAVDFFGLLADEIENAQVHHLALLLHDGGFAGRSAGKQAIEDDARVDFLGRGRRWRAPGDIGLIDAAIAGVAEAVLLAEIAAEFQRGKPRRVADLLGDDLIAGDGGADVVSLCLENRDAGKIGGHRAGVGAAAAGVGVGQVAKDQHVVFEGLERGQRLAEFKIGSASRWISRTPF